MALTHVTKEKGDSQPNDLYRVLYYDCEPLTKKLQHPLTGKAIDFSKSPSYRFRQLFYSELKKLRKVALRLGQLRDNNGWIINSKVLKKLIKGTIEIKDIHESDLRYDVIQKEVDAKLSLDIASLAYKRLVDRIVLIAGDRDFVPAAKLARREGIDIILDSMRQKIHPSLFEHIDGMKTWAPKRKVKRRHATTAAKN